jgi:hypothetical protein
MPTVLLAFDEAHDLSASADNRDWTNFMALRRALRQLRSESVFTLFLSTTGDLFQFTPVHYLDKSHRVQMGTLNLHSPFVETDFDVLYDPVGDEEITIEDAAGFERIARMGRPVYVLHA